MAGKRKVVGVSLGGGCVLCAVCYLGGRGLLVRGRESDDEARARVPLRCCLLVPVHSLEDEDRRWSMG